MVEVRACIDRVAPPKTNNERMALVKNSLWQPGDAIRISFLDGDIVVHERVKSLARTWLEYVDLNFFFVDDRDADIRISFGSRGSWSYIGTGCRDIRPPEPTMNYGWLTPQSTADEARRVILHEFGHALGCIHEHQNPEGGIRWRKEVVYAYYAGAPNFWSAEQVNTNLFDVYNTNALLNTPMDGGSIMMYPIDARFTLDGFSVGLNSDLSETDKEFIGRAYRNE